MSAVPQLSIQTFLNPFELYSDSRKHGYQGSSRNVRLGRVTPPGGGYISKSEDESRVVVTGKESLRILRVSEPSQGQNTEHKFIFGRGGHRIDESRNFWEGSGLKIDSASTDVAWGHGQFNNKILTSARNGELILWDLNKSGAAKYERRAKDHIRSIHKMSVSHVVHHYCITGSADGHMRVWDLRDLSKSIMRVHHPISVRSLVFSPSLWQPLQAVVGLDNGSIYRWDLKMGQRGQLDKLPVAHTASVTALDWCSAGSMNPQGSTGDAGATGLGWLVSGGLDRSVKVWDLTSPSSNAHIPHKPTYTLHPSFAVRRLAWRPGYECEVAVASNAEYATPSVELPQSPPSSGAPGILTRVGSGLGLDSFMRASNLSENVYSVKDKLNAAAEAKMEIWDVRRPWLAKWSVTGSAAEGGVTDIAFSDPHALWAQQASGSFSQFDLRETTKPIDAIPRVAATWEAGGSIAFVTDNKERWEIPYDDIQPDQRNPVELPKPPKKALGDPTARIKSQTMATYTPLHDISGIDRETFTILARKYIFEGPDRKDICIDNAKVALEAGHESAAQVWLLLGAALAQYVPEYPPTPLESPPNMPKNLSTSSMLQQSPHQLQPLTGYSFPPSATTGPVELSPAVGQKLSPVTTRSTSGSVPRIPSYSHSHSASRRITPTSSTSSSPRHLPISLPPVTPRRASFFSRRDSLDTSALVNTAMRRSSIPSSALPSASSPVDRSTPSLRHVGEGVLDDSDSSGSADGDEEGDDTAGANSSEEEAPPLVSPGLTAVRTIPIPSPLSRVAGRQAWTEDEEDHERDKDDGSSTSPSPQSSTDSESHGSSSPKKRSASAKARRRSSGHHFKSRSRSSTVASLAAPKPRPLIHQESQSSIRTVTVAEASLRDQEGALARTETDVTALYRLQDVRPGHNRQKSQTVSELVLNTNKAVPPTPPDFEDDSDDSIDASQLTERRIEIIKLEENRFREATLGALKMAVEEFADEGDVQLCAMLSLVAPNELRISRTRASRFVESYIELLTRLRLHTCAAYLRKYCEIEEIRKTTLLETTVYTSCGKCRKPLLLPAGTFSGKAINQGAFSYCLTCKASTVMCCICRLPVRSLLFQCSVCNHGGHQACYRQYYMQHPMLDFKSSFLPSDSEERGRTSLRMQPSTSEDDSTTAVSNIADASITQSQVQVVQSTMLAGHPCAAGCGHICWAANRDTEELQ
ncbi:hypothetical protein CPB84DRAFT_1787859 [Gymnopilus junonius]|uniref:WDR59/RTC1-like RING zinc finger domain-containing protein n=1 Tax=Gymnopilus junonius TaxID=109634 RepID=A0A9P5NEQ0_GYMJU|nr:hypothetical protein CPB84DRAFT_1787859 [Gymnopilus junonius]